jgi:hypothetical protein
MNLKSNINKIHYLLSESFANTKLQEKSDIKFGKYFNIQTSNGNKEMKIILEFTEIEKNSFRWFYSENPLNEKSDLIERISTTDSFLEDVKDIFDKNRFSEDYLVKIKK